MGKFAAKIRRWMPDLPLFLLLLVAVGLLAWSQPWKSGRGGENPSGPVATTEAERKKADESGRSDAASSQVDRRADQDAGQGSGQATDQGAGDERADQTGSRPILAVPGRQPNISLPRETGTNPHADRSASGEAVLEELTASARESYAGSKASLRISIRTRDAVSGSIVRVELVDEAMKSRVFGQTSVNRGRAKLDLDLPADLPAGNYSVIARIGRSQKQLAYRILEDPNPLILDLTLDRESQVQGDETGVEIRGKTKNLPDHSRVRLYLTDDKGASYSVVKDLETDIRSDAFRAQMTIPASLPEGNYRIRAEIKGLMKDRNYRILRRADRKIKGVFLSQNSSVQGEDVDLAIGVDTADLSAESGLDQSQLQGRHAILAELVRQDGTSLSPRLTAREMIDRNRVDLRLRIPGRLAEGTYKLKISVPDFGLVQDRDYTVLHKCTPKLKKLTSDRDEQVEKSETVLGLTLETADLEDGQKVYFELVDSAGRSLIPRLVTETAIRENRAEASLTVPAAVTSGSYRIKATCAGLELMRDYRVLYKPVPEILEAKANQHRISFGYAQEIQVKLKLKDIPAGTEMLIRLLKEDETPVSSFTEERGQAGEGAFDHPVKLPALEPGKYLIQIVCGSDPAVSVTIDLEAVSADAGWDELLDYNGRGDEFYWFDEFNQAYPYKDSRAPYDPKKPTVIFVHGWQNGGVKDNWANDFKYNLTYTVKENGKDVTRQTSFNSAKAWVDAGYNVGIYNWVQIADEPGEGFWRSTPYSAEAKIWTCDYKKNGMPMRYRLKNGKFIRETEKTAADLFVDKYLDAMKGYQGDFIEFGGHSLGNQMVLRAAYLIQEKVDRGEADLALMPQRLTLLDPYYSGSSEKYAVYQGEKMTNSQAAVRIARDLVKRKVVLQMYKSSKLTTSSLAGDINSELEKLTAYNRTHPDMYGFSEQAKQHNTAYQFYYWSMATANRFYHSSQAEIASRMGAFFRREQDAGKMTIDPADDAGKIQVAHGDQYVPVEDLVLTDDKGRDLTRTDQKDCDLISVGVGQYRRMSASVRPTNASAQIVVLEKVSGDMDAVQLAYDGNIKGLKRGEVLLRAHVVTRDQTGEITGNIEKYFRVRVF